MFRSAAPEEGGRKATSWSVVSLGGGEKVVGWLAGHPVWVWVHYVGASKPCHVRISDNALSRCPYCERRPRVERKGYVPLYDLSGKPIVIVVGENVEDVFGRIEVFDPIKVIKVGPKNTGSLLLKDTGRARYKPSLPGRDQPADIREWLLRLWGDETVKSWAKSQVRDPEPIPEPIPEPPAIEPPVDGDAGRRKLQELMRSLAVKKDALEPVGESLPVPERQAKRRRQGG